MKANIRTKIFVSFSALLIVSLGLVTLLWYTKYSSHLQESAENYMYRSISEANSNFELTLKDIDYISTIISLNKPNVIDVLMLNPADSYYERLQKDRKLDNFISSLYGYKYYISSILVAGIDGRAYTRGTTVPASDFLSSHWYKDMLEQRGNKVFVTTHSSSDLNRVSAYPSQNVVSIARTILNGEQAVGFVVIDFSYEVVQRLFSTPLPNDSTLFLLDEKGNFVYTPQNANINGNISTTAFAEVLPQLTSQSGHLTLNVGGEKQFVVYYKSAYTNWTTVALVPQSKLLAESLRTANASLLVPILTIIAALVVATILANQITKNIAKLRNAMKRVGTGNLTEMATIASGDEVEELSRGFNQMVDSIKLLLEDVKRTEEQRHEMEFKALQAQINPHFLFNTLNQIKWLADIQKADNIKELVASLLALLHSSMGKDGKYVTVREEIAYLKHYLNIQEFRYYNKFDAIFDIDPSILDERLLKFILQPIVENALLHGLVPLKGKGMLSIKGYADGGSLVFRVSDNGAGIPPDKLETIFEPVTEKNKSRFSGIGLRNVRDRIRLHYGHGYDLTIESIPELFTTVTVRMPFVTGEEE